MVGTRRAAREEQRQASEAAQATPQGSPAGSVGVQQQTNTGGDGAVSNKRKAASQGGIKGRARTQVSGGREGLEAVSAGRAARATIAQPRSQGRPPTERQSAGPTVTAEEQHQAALRQLAEADAQALLAAQRVGQVVTFRVNHFHRSHTPYLLPVPANATVRFLKRQLARIVFDGKKYPANQQELQFLLPGATILTSMSDIDRHGAEMMLASYGFVPSTSPHSIWMLIISPGTALLDPTMAASPVLKTTSVYPQPSPAAPAARARTPLQPTNGPCSPGVLAAAAAQQAGVSPVGRLEQQPGVQAAAQGFQALLSPPAQSSPSNRRPTAQSPAGEAGPRRRPQVRWTKEEVEQLISGVEIHGLGHWGEIKKRFGLEDRTVVDLKDKWRNLEKAVRASKQLRGVDLSPEMRSRILQCLSEYCP